MVLRALLRRQQLHLSGSFPSQYDKIILAKVDSTNAHAARVFRKLNRPTWILGLKQTDGRGRRGRKWLNYEGNFAATLVLFTKETPDTLALRSFVTSLALFETLRLITGSSIFFSLKWPNDVLMNGRKLAGILLETLSQGFGKNALAIGVGVNLTADPDISKMEVNAIPPISLFSTTGIKISPEQFLDYLAEHYAIWEAEFLKNGFQPIREAWLHHAERLGESVTAKLPNCQISGRFDTIDEKGHLVLTTAQGKEVIAAADVFF